MSQKIQENIKLENKINKNMFNANSKTFQQKIKKKKLKIAKNTCKTTITNKTKKQLVE